MTDVKKVDLFTAQSAQSKAVTNPVEKEKAEKERLNAEIQRELATKEDRQKAIEEAKQAYLNFGTVEGQKVDLKKMLRKWLKIM